MSVDPTVLASTGQIPVPGPDPSKPPREPLDPEHRAWLIGLLAGGVIFGVAVASWVALSGANNTRKAEEKTEQVSACATIEDGTAALACVVQIDE